MPLLFMHWPELLLVVGLGVILFGARKLPQLGAGLGQGIRNFKNSLSGKEEAEKLEETSSEGAKKETPAS